MSGVEHYQFILVGLIVTFVIGQEYVGPQIGKDISNAVDENKAVLHVIFQLDMGLNPLVDIFIELGTVGLLNQYLLDVLGCFALHVHQKFQQRRVLIPETLTVEKLAELFE